MNMEAKIRDMEEEKAQAESQGGDATEKFSKMSPKELEDLRSQSEEELEDAKGKKNFVKCMELQVWHLDAASSNIFVGFSAVRQTFHSCYSLRSSIQGISSTWSRR